MRRSPTRARKHWRTASAALAPLALIGGWTVAASRQPEGFDQVRDTISALAALDAADRWVMTAGLATLGVCHVVTAWGLAESDIRGRALLALGGAGTLAVAALPTPSPAHVPAATIAFVALAVWPVTSGLPDRRSGWVATAGLLALLAWLGIELRHEDRLGLSERLLAGAEALWPLYVVWKVRNSG